MEATLQITWVQSHKLAYNTREKSGIQWNLLNICCKRAIYNEDFAAEKILDSANIWTCDHSTKSLIAYSHAAIMTAEVFLHCGTHGWALSSCQCQDEPLAVANQLPQIT